MLPPPLLYVVAIVAGDLLDRQWPLQTPTSAALDAIAAVLLAGGLLLVFPSLLRFRRFHTSPFPFRPANTLVTSGAYRFTRNPMYVGMALLTVAAALLLETYWPLVLLPPTLYLVQKLVIAREERYLRRRFGAEYEAYTRRVRRWL